MQENEKFDKRDDLFSHVVRAGKRTYFFDVKVTRTEQKYITITESKRRFNEEQGKFFYEKHKIFLYGEDFDKFKEGLNAAIDFIESDEDSTVEKTEEENNETIGTTLDVNFEDLGDE